MQRNQLPEHLSLGPFSVADAAAGKVPRSRLRAGDLEIVHRGVRVPVGFAERDIIGRCRMYAPRLTDHQFFSHSTAASIWGLPMSRGVNAEALHVSAVSPHRAPRLAGVVGHHLDEPRIELAVLVGLPVTSPTETWRHLATMPRVSVDQLVAVGDALLRRQDPLATRGELLRAVARHGGHRGVRRLRAAYDLVRAGTDSPRETALRVLLVRGGLPEPEVNAEIVLPDGTTTPGDLVYRDHKVLVEYDGAVHLTPAQAARDAIRWELLAAAGWTIVRVLAAHMSDPDQIVRRVQAALARSRVAN